MFNFYGSDREFFEFTLKGRESKLEGRTRTIRGFDAENGFSFFHLGASWLFSDGV